MTAAITFKGVRKRFGDFTALDGVDLVVAAGEKLVICGPSGSGKSTLIRTVNALEGIDAGEIVVDGVTLTREPAVVREVRQRVGMVFQSFNLFPHLTALQNCTLPLVRVRGLSLAEAEVQAMACLARVHIPEQAHKYPAALSGGQQQRVAIARAMAMRPKILLLDEPTSALDPEMVQEVLGALQELGEGDVAFVLVTHEMGFARRFADRMVFMEAGRVLADEPPDAFFERSAEPRVAAFLAKVLHQPAAAP